MIIRKALNAENEDEPSIEEQLITLKTSIVTTTDTLNELLKRSDIVQAVVFDIPEYDLMLESKAVTTINVSTLTGGEALSRACHSFSKLKCSVGKSRKAVYRNPGIIVVKNNHVEIDILTTAINKLKEEFKICVAKSGSTAKARYEQVHSLFEMINTLQVYRRINVIKSIDDPITQVSFSWTTRPTILKVDKAKVIAMIERQKKSPPDHLLASHWDLFLDSEIADVNNIGKDVILRLRRDTKAFPLVNLKSTNMKISQLQAGLPIIVLQKSTIKVRDLPTYDATQTRAKRSDKRSSNVPLVERIGLYECRKT